MLAVHRSAWVVALALLVAAPSEAQRAREEEELAPDELVLKLRGREVMVNEESLELVGIAEGNKDFLAGSPALARADFGIALVDRDELRARKLALYEGEVSFDRGPRKLRSERVASPGTLGGGTRTASARTREVREPTEASLWPWFVSAFCTALFVTARVYARRSAEAKAKARAR